MLTAGKISNDFFLMSPVSVWMSKKSIISLCRISSVSEIAPVLAPNWLTAVAVSLMTLTRGITPQEAQCTPLMSDPLDLMFPKYAPIPHPNLEICAMFSML